VIPLGLTAAQQAALHDTLVGHHSIRVSVYLMNLSGSKLADISNRLIDGQVNVDGDADITRSCTLSLLDVDRSLSLDSDSPDSGALYVDRMIQVQYAVKDAASGSSWVTIPLFTGPVVKVDRDDAVISVECQGKELLGMGQVWTPRTYKKGTRKTEVMQSILQGCGETKFNFPEYSTPIPSDYAIGRDNTPWGVAKYLANGMGLQLFYDGRGVARLRARPQTSVFRFRAGDNGSILSSPKVTYTLDNLKNIVWVRGSINPGSGGLSEYKIGAVAQAPAAHPLSPVRLGRNGKPRYLLEIYDNSTITSKSEAQRFANSILASHLLQSVDVAFDAFPLPHLEEMDVCRYDTPQASNAFRAVKFSIPLLAGGVMAVGYNRRVSVRARVGRLQRMA
jgi:hypothetical protein